MSQSSTTAEVTHVAFDKRLNSYIPFSNASDACLAQFVLKRTVSSQSTLSYEYEIIKSMLAMIRQPHFDPKDITFKSIRDIHAHVGEKRAEMVNLTVSRAINANPTLGRIQGIPDIVMDCTFSLLEEISDAAIDTSREEIDQLCHFDANRMTYGYSSRSTTQVVDLRMIIRQMARSLSLVHPTWTNLARRLLGRYLSSAGKDRSLYAYAPLRNPLIGHWTRGLDIKRVLQGVSLRNDEMTTVICPMLARMPHLRFLKADAKINDPKWMVPFLQAVRGLTALAHIHLGVNGSLHFEAFGTFIRDISKLGVPLKTIKLECPDSRLPSSILPPFFAHLNQIRSLQTIHIRCGGDYTRTHGIMFWERKYGAVETSHLLPFDFSLRWIAGGLDTLSPEALNAHPFSLFAPYFPVRSKDDPMAVALMKSEKLQELHIKSHPEQQMLPFHIVPPSLEILVLHLNISEIDKQPSCLAQVRIDQWLSEWADEICELVNSQRCPKLRLLHVLFHTVTANPRVAAHPAMKNGKVDRSIKKIENLRKKLEAKREYCRQECHELSTSIDFDWRVVYH